MAEQLEPYLQQQNIPGWSGALNNMVRALMAGYMQTPKNQTSPGPVAPPVSTTLPENNPNVSAYPSAIPPTAGIFRPPANPFGKIY
jgi:hypothetical protein